MLRGVACVYKPFISMCLYCICCLACEHIFAHNSTCTTMCSWILTNPPLAKVLYNCKLDSVGDYSRTAPTEVLQD